MEGAGGHGGHQVSVADVSSTSGGAAKGEAQVILVTPEVLRILGARPLLGRLFEEREFGRPSEMPAVAVPRRQRVSTLFDWS